MVSKLAASPSTSLRYTHIHTHIYTDAYTYVHNAYTHMHSQIHPHTHAHTKDEHGIFEMMIVSSIVLLGLIGSISIFYSRLRKDETDLAHHVLIVVLGAMVVQTTAVILRLSHLTKYSVDGIGLPGLRNASLFFEQIPPLIIVALFIVIAKGLFISSRALRDARSVIEVLLLPNPFPLLLLSNT
jgi:hypothetical protein